MYVGRSKASVQFGSSSVELVARVSIFSGGGGRWVQFL